MRIHRRKIRLKEDSSLYDIQREMNSGSVKMIKVVGVFIEYFDNSVHNMGKSVGEDDFTNLFERYYTNINDILLDVHDNIGLSADIKDYSFSSTYPYSIMTSGLFNQDYDIPSLEELDEYERGRIDLYDGVLSIDIEVLK